MRLNAKAAKEMRSAAKYRNQTATPSHPEFPGVARLYSAPVYATRTKVEHSYEKRNGEMVKVLRNKRSMVMVHFRGRRSEPQLVMDWQVYPKDHPKAGEKFWGPKLEVIPVAKPVAATGAKKIYRNLKRLYRKGLLNAAYSEIYEAALPPHLRSAA